MTALEQLEYIVHHQKTVSTSRLEHLVTELKEDIRDLHDREQYRIAKQARLKDDIAGLNQKVMHQKTELRNLRGHTKGASQ